MSKYDFFAKKKISRIGNAIIMQMYAKLEKLFFLHFPQNGKNILEIGSGKGIFASICEKRGINYKGYEPNSIMYNQLTQKGFNVVNRTVPPLEDDNDSQDAIVLLHVLEHMPSSLIAEELLKDIYNKLKSDGIVFLVFPSYLCWKQDFHNLDYTHNFITTELNVSQMLSDAGFSHIIVKYFYGNFFCGFGRFIYFCVSLMKNILTLLLPRKITRSMKFQKMGITFAENIIIIGKKVL